MATKLRCKPNALCLVCSTPFYAQPARVKQGMGKFCSIPCRKIHTQQTQEQRTCLWCNTQFTMFPCDLKGRNKNRQHCSGKCRHKWLEARQEKHCSKCKSVKDISNFSLNPKTIDGHRTVCKGCESTYDSAHPEARRLRVKKSYQRHKKQRVSEGRTYRNTHREDIRVKDRERYHRDPDGRNAYVAIRQNRLKGTSPGEKISLLELAIRDAWICHICKKKVTQKNWSRDHIVPVCQGGTHTWNNVLLAHRACNSERGAGRLPAQYLLFG